MRKLPAINIQFPISRLISSGEKRIETRDYDIPKQYVGRELLVVETPGITGKFKARAIGIVIFDIPFRYQSRADFYRDSQSHGVAIDSPWAWRTKGKWGWPIKFFKAFRTPIEINERRGIVFTKSLTIEFT